MKKPEQQDWQPTYYCPDCKDEFYSEWAGKITYCKCGASGVDQTPYSLRTLGKAQKPPVKNDNSGGYIGVEGWGYF